jgi:hypothetical protein
MRYITVITVLLAIGGCSAISDFEGYTFGSGYDPDGGAAGAAGWGDPYQGDAGAAGAAGTAGTAALAGQGGAAGAAGQLEPFAGAGGEIEPLGGAGGAGGEPDAGLDEPDAGPVEPDTMQCQPCEVESDCDGDLDEDISCGKVTGDEPTRVCLVREARECPYGLVFRGGVQPYCTDVGCVQGYCVPPEGDCEAWLDARY